MGGSMSAKLTEEEYRKSCRDLHYELLVLLAERPLHLNILMTVFFRVLTQVSDSVGVTREELVKEIREGIEELVKEMPKDDKIISSIMKFDSFKDAKEFRENKNIRDSLDSLTNNTKH
jgi:predicted RNase H-like HicB family nuclease